MKLGTARTLTALVVCGGLGGALAQLAGGCQQSPTLVPVRSLERSGKASFVCLSPTEPNERPLAECTAQQFSSICQYEYTDDAGTLDAGIIFDDAGVPVGATLLPHLYALVTQTTRGEVAVIDTSALTGAVLDENPQEPGAEFLHIGALPTGIASTPGSVASFVGVAEIGHAGLFAIPSSQIRPTAAFGIPDTCVGTGDASASAVPQFTSWPACALPSAPGDILLIDDPGLPDGTQRESCDGQYLSVNPDLDTISYKEGSLGRSKLVVALPDLGGVAVLDAQDVFSREVGSFDPCTVERWLPLKVDLTGLAGLPALPQGLACSNGNPSVEPLKSADGGADAGAGGPYHAQPGGLSYADGKLYIADLSAPIIHVVDMHGPDGVATPLPPRRAGAPPPHLGGEPDARRLRQQGRGRHHPDARLQAVPLRDRHRRRERDGLRHRARLDDPAPPPARQPAVEPVPAARFGSSSRRPRPTSSWCSATCPTSIR